MFSTKPYSSSQPAVDSHSTSSTSTSKREGDEDKVTKIAGKILPSTGSAVTRSPHNYVQSLASAPTPGLRSSHPADSAALPAENDPAKPLNEFKKGTQDWLAGILPTGEIYEEIVTCYQLSAKELDLSRYSLTSLPTNIGQLTTLTKLNLFDNQFTALPKEIWTLTALTHLNLSSNQLTSLSTKIRQLTALKELNLFGNQFSTLPKEIWTLTELTWLELANNYLTALPKIRKLTKLDYLYLGNNQLTALPKGIEKLTALTVLVVKSNALIALPEGIRTLTGLVWLDLQYNRLTALPKEIGKLTKLERLTLSGNSLTSVPKEILNLNPSCSVWLGDSLSERGEIGLREAARDIPFASRPSIRGIWKKAK